MDTCGEHPNKKLANMNRPMAKAKRSLRTKRVQQHRLSNKQPAKAGITINVLQFDFSNDASASSSSDDTIDGATSQSAFSRQNEPVQQGPPQRMARPMIFYRKGIIATALSGDKDVLLTNYNLDKAEASDNPAKLARLQNQLNCALVQGIAGRNIPMVTVLLDLGAEVTCLVRHYAITSNSEDIIDILIERGVSFTGEGNKKLPLHDVARIGNLSVMRKLLNLKQIDVNERDPVYGHTALQVAIQYNKNFCANLLLDYGADITAQDHEGRTPLHEAATRGNTTWLKRLLDAGADSHVLDKQGKSPWFCAFHNGHIGTSDTILEYMHVEHFSRILPSGQSYMHIAAIHSGSLPMLKKLQEMGCELTGLDGAGNTVLMSALSTKSPSLGLVRYLLENNEVKLQVNIKNSKNETALGLLFMNRERLSNVDKTIAHDVVAAGADVNVELSNGNTLLMEHFTDNAKLELLLELGADPNRCTKSGSNVLWMASQQRSYRGDVIQKLLNLNTDIRLSSYVDEETGTTAFIQVLNMQDEPTAELMYRAGCSLTGVKNWIGTDDAKAIMQECPRIQGLVDHMKASGKLVTAPSLWEQARLATLGSLGARSLEGRLQSLPLPPTVTCLLDFDNYQKWQKHEEMCC